MKIQVIFNVDSEVVKSVAEMEDVIDAIKNELGWVRDSGIFVNDIKIIENDGPLADDLPNNVIA